MANTQNSAIHTIRDARGRFAPGNAGGPGRPARAVERDYMTALCDEISLDDWREIVRQAVGAAKDGDTQARNWITRHVLGSEPMALMALAVREVLAIPSYAEVAVMVHDELTDMNDRLGWNTDSPLKRALELSQEYDGRLLESQGKGGEGQGIAHEPQIEQEGDEFASQFKQAMSGDDEEVMAFLARYRYPHMLDGDTTADDAR